MKALLEALARGLVREPGGVSVHEWTEGDLVRLELEVDAEDRGRVIGRKGRTVEAMRTLLGAAARRRGLECDVEILD